MAHSQDEPQGSEKTFRYEFECGRRHGRMRKVAAHQKRRTHTVLYDTLGETAGKIAVNFH